MSVLPPDLPSGAGLEPPHYILRAVEQALAVATTALMDLLQPRLESLGYAVRAPPDLWRSDTWVIACR